eukprot:TRINITY_DN30234_c0_g1_i1.p1 TRINITY_DN30234_c0_g1~~TRINITY_DN30234_c0_g1_i1.p1  ORF type:complete len:343 (+),score=117.29 TRINITY_DN30234_c0_g1_i1:74-1030(+)
MGDASGVADDAFSAGTLLGGRYEVSGELGGGSGSCLLRCTRKDQGGHFAVRVFRATAAGVRAQAAERAVLADLLKAELPRLLCAPDRRLADYFFEHQHGSQPLQCTVYPLARCSLREVIDNASRPLQCDRIAIGLFGALAELHRRGWAHGDVKPQNVLFLGLSMRAFDVALGDFCTAARVPPEGLSGEAQTVPYRAPEVVFDRRWGTPADVWSAACVLYEAITREPLLGCASEGELRPALADLLGDCPEEQQPAREGPKAPQLAQQLAVAAGVDTTLAALLRHCLLRDPEQRLSADTIARLPPLQVCAFVCSAGAEPE